MPPLGRHELRYDHGDHLVMRALLDVVDIIEQRADNRTIGRLEDHERDLMRPLVPLFLHAEGLFGRHLDIAGANVVRDRDRVPESVEHPPVKTRDRHDHRVFELLQSPGRGEASQRELRPDRDVMFVNLHEKQHDRRDEQDHQPRTGQELARRYDQQDDERRNRADSVDRHSVLPARLLSRR